VARVNARSPGRGVEPRISQAAAAAEARCARITKGPTTMRRRRKAGTKTNDKTPQGCRWNRLWEEYGGAGGGVEDIVGKRAAESERAVVFGSMTSLGSDRNAAHGSMGAAMRVRQREYPIV
jgi:hypothetical protein